MKKTYRFSLRIKLMLFTTVLAFVTYSVSAFFLYIVYDIVSAYWAVSIEVFTVLTLLLGIIWSGILAFLAARFLTKPLEKLERVASDAASGNLHQSIDIHTSDDEIRSLGLAFDAMLKNLRNMVANIEAHFAHTNQTVIDMRTASHDVAQYSEAIGVSIADISRGAENASEAIQHTVEAVEKATELAENVQEKASGSRKKSQTMLETLHYGENVVNQLVQGIQQLAKNQESSLADVNRLNDNAKQVESITTMVGDIAEQTNLLALNASIEAARAGEHGKGFAVVAEEVRKLADESTQAVQRISELISLIQDDVKQVVTNINDNVTKANQEAESGSEANVAIEEMARSVEDVAGEIDAISKLVDEQMTSIRSTASQSQEVAAVAEETSAGAEEVNASIQEQAGTVEKVERLAHDLERQAHNLNRQIQQFKLS